MNDRWVITAEHLPLWFSTYVMDHFQEAKKRPAVKDLSSIEEVKQRYRQDKKQ